MYDKTNDDPKTIQTRFRTTYLLATRHFRNLTQNKILFNAVGHGERNRKNWEYNPSLLNMQGCKCVNVTQSCPSTVHASDRRQAYRVSVCCTQSFRKFRSGVNLRQTHVARNWIPRLDIVALELDSNCQKNNLLWHSLALQHLASDLCLSCSGALTKQTRISTGGEIAMSTRILLSRTFAVNSA